MKKLRFEILQWLATFGAMKPIFDSLTDRDLKYSPHQFMIAVRHLETLGLIRIQIPPLVTAELTPLGKELLQDIEMAS